MRGSANDQRDSARVYRSGDKKTVYMTHLGKDARENMGADVLLSETRQS